MLLVVLALNLLPARSGWLWPALQIAGGGYFVWIGGQALRSRRQLELAAVVAQEAGGTWASGLREGLLVSCLNPKLPIFYAGLFGVLREAAMPAWGLVLSMLWMTLVVLVWDLALVRLLGQARWRSWLQRRVAWLDRLCGGLLLALGLWLLLG
jgi:threonine/homoserine/homoserine lactone efflux protein